MSTTTATTFRIKADWGYFPGTFHAPTDGYLMGEEQYDGFTGKTFSNPLEFATVEEAFVYLTERSQETPYGYSDAMDCEYDGDGQFSVGGTYVTSHGQHSRPRYTIVSAKSGRCNKAIIAECAKLSA